MHSSKKRQKVSNDYDEDNQREDESNDSDDNSEQSEENEKFDKLIKNRSDSDSNDSENVNDSDKDKSSDEEILKRKILSKKNESDQSDHYENSDHSSDKSDDENSENEKSSVYSSEKSDKENSACEKNSNNDSDSRDSDGKYSNAKESDAKDSDAKDSDAKDSDAKDSDARDSDARDSDAKDSDAKDSDAKDSDDRDSDSKDSDDEQIINKKDKLKNVFDSDEDSDNEKMDINKEGKSMDEIFGDISSEDDDEDKKDIEDEKKFKQKAYEEKGNKDNRLVFDSEEEEDDDVIPETRIDVTIPRIVADLGKEIHFIKLPNFLSVDTHPYDPSWYEDEIDEDEICDEEGRARMKLKVENTIRWRNVLDKHNNMVKESNARVVKWSDGSMSLHLGSEIFDITKQHLLHGDNNHLYVRQGTGLQGQAVFKTKLTFRPHSTDSFTHKKMTLSLADRSLKTQKIRVLPTVGLDPEANRNEMIKKEEDKLKASIRRENKARRVRERISQRGPPTASYLEPDNEEDEDGAISLSAIKNKYKKGGQNYADVYSDSESENSDDSMFNKKKTNSVKKTRIEESDDDD